MGNKFLILCRFTSSYFSIWEKSIRCSVEENGYKIGFYTSSPVRFEELTLCVSPCLLICKASHSVKHLHAFLLSLTTWMSRLLFESCTDASERKNGNMSSEVLFQQLISKRTWIFLSNATRLSSVSISAQYLERIHGQRNCAFPHCQCNSTINNYPSLVHEF